MNENARQILQMLADQKITADEAAQLLDALEHTETPEEEQSSLTHEPNRRRIRYLRVLVDMPESFTGDGPGKVNVRIPVQLMRAGVQLASLMPPKALDHVNEELKKSGVPIDVTQLKPQHIEELIEALDEMTVEVDQPDAKVRVFCE